MHFPIKAKKAKKRLIKWKVNGSLKSIIARGDTEIEFND